MISTEMMPRRFINTHQIDPVHLHYLPQAMDSWQHISPVHYLPINSSFERVVDGTQSLSNNAGLHGGRVMPLHEYLFNINILIQSTRHGRPPSSRHMLPHARTVLRDYPASSSSACRKEPPTTPHAKVPKSIDHINTFPTPCTNEGGADGRVLRELRYVRPPAMQQNIPSRIRTHPTRVS